jgi:hypothetical protein
MKQRFLFPKQKVICRATGKRCMKMKNLSKIIRLDVKAAIKAFEADDFDRARAPSPTRPLNRQPAYLLSTTRILRVRLQ